MEEYEGIIARFIELREKYGHSKAKFGRLLGVSHSAIFQMETGKIKINEKHIKLISGVLKVNEDWLRTGIEPMYKDGKVPEEDVMLEMFRKLSPESRKIVLDYINVVLNNEKKMKLGAPTPEKGEHLENAR
jgi:transcriptional regulator with XRE-family HTH domain